MAFITYRVSTSPTVPTVTTAKGSSLLNTEVDGNFKSLDVSKLETNGSAASLTAIPMGSAAGILAVANGGTGSNTASTGTGGVVLSNSPTLVAPSLGVPSFIDLTNARYLPLDGAISVTGKLPIAFGGTNALATPTAGAVPYGTGTAYAFTGVGTAGQVLTSAGAGIPTWTTVTTSAGGSNTQLQYNSSGSFAGSPNMTFNGTTLALNSLSVSTTLGVTGTSTLSGNAIISVTDNTNAALRITQLGTGNALLVEDSTNPDASPFVIDASGFVMAGSTVNIDNAQIQTFNGAQTNFRWNAASTGPSSYLKKSRSATIGLYSIVNSGDTLGALRWSGDDGVTFIDGASIIGQVDGTPGTNDMPGRLVFSTTADGASSPTERMRISSSGNVGIGGSGTANVNLDIRKIITGAVSAFGVNVQATIQSDVTTTTSSFQTYPSTAAAAFTLTSLRHFDADQGTIGVGSTVTNQYGFRANSTITGATNNYGFYGGIASGTGRYNLYMAGTAANYLAGALTVASKVTTLAQVETPDVTSLLTTANTYPTTRPSLNLDFANSATLDPRITFTRGTNATYTGSDGLVKNTAGINSPRFDWDPVTRECKGLLIEEARTNLFTYSNNMSNSGWTRAAYSGGTYTDNQLSPDGSTSGLLVTGLYNTNLGSIATDIVSNTLSVIAGQTITFSVYAKLATANIAPLILRIKTNGSATSFTSSTTLSVDTWTRCVLTCTVPTGDTSCDVVIGASSTPLNVIVWGAQFEVGAFPTSYIPSSVTWTGRASTATYVGSNGLIQTAASGVARYQYNPTNLSVAPFLLLEPAATNLVTYSDDTSAYASIDNSSIVVNQIAAPDGNTTADKIVSTLTGGTNNCWVQKTTSVAANTQTYTFSVFVKAGTSPTTTLNLQLSGGTYQQVVGIITWATNTIAGGTLVNYGNGWFKASVTLTNNGTNTILSPRIYVRDQSSANVSGEYEYIWGWQVETGSVATSYIPTVASQVTRIADTSTSAQTTRSADVATMTGTNFSSWYNQTEGTFVLKADIIQRSSSTSYPRMIAAVGTDYNNEEIGIYMVTTGTFAGLPNSTVTSAGVQTFGFVVVVPTLYAWTASIAYKANDSYFMAAGLTGNTTDTSVTLPICTELRIFGAVRYQPMSSGHIAKLTYYPTRLSNSTLQALTT